MHSQQRFDVEDLNVMLSALRTDSKFYTNRFVSNQTYIISGFTIAENSSNVVIAMENSTLINGPATEDFSWYTSEESAPAITLAKGAGGLQSGRNFVELEIGSENGTILQRAFWDQSAGGGSGSEFTNDVETVTDLLINVHINQSGFNTTNTDRIPLAIVDYNETSDTITGIQDKRKMFFRLGNPDDPEAGYTWGSQTEPTTKLTFTSDSIIPFVAGETIYFGSGASATVVVGGVNSIEVMLFSNINYIAGDAVTTDVIPTGSGASGTLGSYYESFVGADKDIKNYRDLFSALMTEIRTLKNTQFWHEQGNVTSLGSLLKYINARVTPLAAGARLAWTGSSLSITDDIVTGQATSDQLAAIRTFGDSEDLILTRQDGSGGSAPITIPDGSVIYVEFPVPMVDRTYSEFGTGSTNFQIATREAFVETDYNFFLAIREGNKLITRGFGELKPGEETAIANETTKDILAFIGAIDETDETPPYTTLPDPSLSNQFTTSDSLTQAISTNAANINDVIAGIQSNYYEPLVVVSGAAADDNEVTGPVAASSVLTLPLDSRNSDIARSYLVGNGVLMVYLNGQHLSVGDHYSEIGSLDTLSTTITINMQLEILDKIEFRILIPEIFGTSGLTQPYFVNYITGQNGSQVSVGDLFNKATDKLSVYRNGLMMHINTIGSLETRYEEPNNNSVSLDVNASSTEVFAFVNRADPAPSVTEQTGISIDTLTVPTYVMGSGRLIIYKNGALLTTEPTAPIQQRMSETNTTTVTLDVAAVFDDVFVIYNSGAAPTFRETYVNNTGTVITIPNSKTYTVGDEKLLVYRNGVLMHNDPALGLPMYRYQETNTSQITLVTALGSDGGNTEALEFVYV